MKISCIFQVKFIKMKQSAILSHLFETGEDKQPQDTPPTPASNPPHPPALPPMQNQHTDRQKHKDLTKIMFNVQFVIFVVLVPTVMVCLDNVVFPFILPFVNLLPTQSSRLLFILLL